jgi:hypothetical protein
MFLIDSLRGPSLGNVNTRPERLIKKDQKVDNREKQYKKEVEIVVQALLHIIGLEVT